MPLTARLIWAPKTRWNSGLVLCQFEDAQFLGLAGQAVNTFRSAGKDQCCDKDIKRNVHRVGDRFSAVMGNETIIWIVLVCGLMGGLISLLEYSGCLGSFSSWLQGRMSFAPSINAAVSDELLLPLRFSM